jgi:hypothetical protein
MGDKLVVNSPTHFGVETKNYIVIGEHHTIQGISIDHKTTYYLEPEYTG